MKKQDLIPIFTQQLEKDLALMREAARASHEAATHEESKPENEYDTRALEAGYIAGAQAKRVEQINEVLLLFKTLSFRDFQKGEAVQSTALVDIKLDGKKSKVLVMPKGGGVSLKYENETIQIVTPSSSLGETLLGLKVGEVAEFEVGDKVRECEVVAIF